MKHGETPIIDNRKFKADKEAAKAEQEGARKKDLVPGPLIIDIPEEQIDPESPIVLLQKAYRMNVAPKDIILQIEGFRWNYGGPDLKNKKYDIWVPDRTHNATNALELIIDKKGRFIYSLKVANEPDGNDHGPKAA